MAYNIRKIGIIGSGQMGSGIAHVCALAGFDVKLNDVNADRIKAGIATMARVAGAEVRLLAFGDGYVEIENTKQVGGLAVAVASDEANNGSGRFDEWKHQRLMGVGADLVIPDFRDAKALRDALIAEGKRHPYPNA